MSISKRQFDLLQAMGITVWQRRELSEHDALVIKSPEDSQNSLQAEECVHSIFTQSPSSTQQNKPQAYTNDEKPALDLKTLLKQPLFNDIIRCLGVSSADLSMSQNQLDLGIINWKFTGADRIEFSHNCLTTPTLDTLTNSPALKKALWQSIGPLSAI